MILVTGGAGFIGPNLVAALAERGERVAVCDRLRSSGKWRNLARVTLRELIAPATLHEWLAQRRAEIAVIVHLGAISSTTETDADLVTEVNFRLPQSLWRWCASSGKPFIYASSAATRTERLQAAGYSSPFTPLEEGCGSTCSAISRSPTLTADVAR